SAAQAHRAVCGDRHRAHVAQGVRPDHVDLEGLELPDQGARDRHVPVQGVLRLRERGRRRHDPADHRRDPHRPLPDPRQPAGGRLMVAIENRLAAKVQPAAKQRSLGSTIRFIVLLLTAVIVLLPVYVLIVTSFKGPGDATATNAWQLPTTWILDNWRNAWAGSAKIPAQAPGLLRSLALVLPASIIAAFLGSMNGYVLAKWRFPHSNLVFTFILFGMFIPYQAVMIPLVELMNGMPIPGGIPQLIFIHVVYG